VPPLCSIIMSLKQVWEEREKKKEPERDALLFFAAPSGDRKIRRGKAKREKREKKKKEKKRTPGSPRCFHLEMVEQRRGGKRIRKKKKERGGRSRKEGAHF